MSEMMFVTGIPRGYDLVREGLVKEKDAEIARLKAVNEKYEKENNELWSKIQASYAQRQSELERLREEFRIYGSPANALRMAANKAKQDNEFIRKLFFAFAKYGEEEIAGFDVDSPDALIKLIESELKAGRKTTYAAVCLVLLNKRYQDVVRKNAILSERNAKLANAIKAAAQVAITN